MRPHTVVRPAPEVEAETVRCLAELIGFPPDCGGRLVSDGEMANLACVAAALAATPDRMQKLAVYASAGTHVWIQKAADLFGFGADVFRSIPVDRDRRMLVSALRREIHADSGRGIRPLVVVATAGSVGSGAVDPLPEIAEICREFDIWFHVDAASGTLAAPVPGAPDALRGMSDADSIAVDPREWLDSPRAAGCVLVRKPGVLLKVETHLPSTFHF